MEEILIKANELGLMIKGTEIFQRFDELRVQLEADDGARKILAEYANYSDEIMAKEQAGNPIEVEEKDKMKELSEKVTDNALLKEFIATQSYYMNMLMLVQKAITEPEGDPIGASKIIQPNSGGKIITDL